MTYIRLFVTLAIASFVAAWSATAAIAQADFPWPEPWTEPQDSTMAAQRPYEYAWRLFIALNWPADVPNRSANPSAKLGEPGPVVWESWKLAYNEVYLPDARNPGPWLDGRNNTGSDTANDAIPLLQNELAVGIGQAGGFEFDPLAAGPPSGNETRLSKDSYEFVVANELYSLDGQTALVASGVESVDFPKAAKEIKAQWRQLNDPNCLPDIDPSRYYSVTTADGNVWGLVALHITTKDLPEWFWATFEHGDNTSRCKDSSGAAVWELPSVDRFACPGSGINCNRAPAIAGLSNTVWSNYRLRGVQLDHNVNGNPTVLANAMVEGGFQGTSSCISCHERSAVNASGSTPSMFTVVRDPSTFDPVALFGVTGGNDPELFATKDPASGQVVVRYTKMDFVWSTARACWKTSAPAAPNCPTGHPCLDDSTLCPF